MHENSQGRAPEAASDPMPERSAATTAPPADRPRSGDDAVVYREALSPSPGVWIVSALLAALCILVFAPISLSTGIVAALLFLGVEIVLLTATTPKIVVTDSEVQVGRARIERRHIGEVTGYRGDDAREQQRAKLHGRAYVALRGWISPVVRMQITDERDETPYWLTSTRHPEQLAEALGGAMHRPDGMPDEAVDARRP